MKTRLLLSALLVTLIINCRGNTVKLYLEETPREINSVYLYSSATGGLPAGTARAFLRLAATNTNKLFLLEALSGEVMIDGQGVNYALLIKAASIEEVRQLKAQVEARALGRNQNLVVGHIAVPRAISTDLSNSDYVALALETRNRSYLRLSASGKESQLKSEDNSFLKKTPATVIETGFVISGSDVHVLRIFGLSSAYEWGNLEKEGIYRRTLAKIKSTQIFLGRLVKP